MIDVYIDTPRTRNEKYLFDLIKNLDVDPIEVFGLTTISSQTPTPGNPATFTNVVYTQTQTAYGEELRSIGTYKDRLYIDRQNRTATIERKIGVVEFDGSENWTEYNPSVHGLSFQVDLSDGVNGAYSSLCSHFSNIYGAWDDTHIGETGIYTDHPWNVTRYFRPPFADKNTVETFKAWLADQKAAGTPVTLYYLLAQTEVESIPYIG